MSYYRKAKILSMSRIINKTNKNVVKSTPFCRWCKDHDKPVHIYTSHYPRDLNGVTICPDILSRKCSYCKESGHTKSSCNVLAEVKRKRRSMQKESSVDEDGFVSVSWRAKNKKNKTDNIVAVATITGFSNLDEDTPFEMDWVTGFKTPSEAFAQVIKKKPGIKLQWGECDEEMDFSEELVWD